MRQILLYMGTQWGHPASLPALLWGWWGLAALSARQKASVLPEAKFESCMSHSFHFSHSHVYFLSDTLKWKALHTMASFPFQNLSNTFWFHYWNRSEEKCPSPNILVQWSAIRINMSMSHTFLRVYPFSPSFFFLLLSRWGPVYSRLASSRQYPWTSYSSLFYHLSVMITLCSIYTRLEI